MDPLDKQLFDMIDRAVDSASAKELKQCSIDENLTDPDEIRRRIKFAYRTSYSLAEAESTGGNQGR